MKLLLTSCLLAVLCPSPDEPDLRPFRRAFAQPLSETGVAQQRVEAIRALGKADSAEIVELLLSAYAKLEGEAAEGVERRRAGLQRDEEDKALNEWRPVIDAAHTIQDLLEKRLHQLTSPESIRALVDRVIEGGRLPLSLRLELVKRAAALTDAQLSGRTFPRVKRSEDVVVALAMSASLGHRVQSWARPVLGLLSHKELPVREAAARALARLGSPDSIVPLIDRLEKEEGRTQQLMAETLEILTAQPNGASVVAWRRWLEAEGEPYVTGQVVLGKGKPTRPAESSANRYHNIPVEGESILYVIDKSLSMRQSLQGAQEGKEDDNRWTRARDELIRVLGELPKHKMFNIIAFAGSLEQYAPKMVRATPANVKRAQQWLRELELEFGTNMYDALERAFIISGRGTFDRYYSTVVDTVFLLTDGRPYVGNKPDDKGRIVRAVKRWNALQQVRLHVIGLGNDVPRQFLKTLASDHSGTLILERAGEKSVD